MARILITAEPGETREDPVLLDERVLPIHLTDGHAAEQLIERIGWAINDAEELGGQARRTPPAREPAMTSVLDSRGATRTHEPTRRSPPDTSRPTRVLVVDDHPAVRWGLVQLLEDQPDLEVAAVATTAEVAVGQAEAEAVDVAVVDYQLGGRNGLWVTRKLRALRQPPQGGDLLGLRQRSPRRQLRRRGRPRAAEQEQPRRGAVQHDPLGGPRAGAAPAGPGGDGPAAPGPARPGRGDHLRDAARRDPRARDPARAGPERAASSASGARACSPGWKRCRAKSPATRAPSGAGSPPPPTREWSAADWQLLARGPECPRERSQRSGAVGPRAPPRIPAAVRADRARQPGRAAGRHLRDLCGRHARAALEGGHRRGPGGDAVPGHAREPDPGPPRGGAAAAADACSRAGWTRRSLVRASRG